jgi:hypothetical protein
MTFSGSAPTRNTPVLPSGGIYSQSLADRTTIIGGRASVLTAVSTFMNAGANIPINIEMGGNRSMLANDFAMINDLAYAIVCTNGGATEQVSTFTYYCHTHFWAINGGQIRSVASSNAHGDYGLRATGYDVTELPNAVLMSNDMTQTARVYKQSSLLTAMTPTATVQSLVVYVVGYSYIPYNLSELEIDHTLSGGTVTRYLVNSISRNSITVYGQNVLSLNLSTAGTNSTSTTGLTYALYDGQQIIIRALQNVKFNNISNVKPTRPSTAVQYSDNLASIYRVITYNLTESTGENLPANTAILSTDTSFAYYLFTSDATNITQADPAYDSSATVSSGSTASTSLVITSFVSSTGIYPTASSLVGAVVGGYGFGYQTVVSVSGTGPTYTLVLSAVPTIPPAGTVTFSSRTQGSRVGDTKISVLQISDNGTVAQLAKGIYLFGYGGRVHRVQSYTSPTNIATGTFSSGGVSSYTLVVTGVAGTITNGMVLVGTGFNSTQTVSSVVVNGTTATVTLSAYPSSQPAGSIQFGTVVSGYITIDANPVSNNSSDGTVVNALSYSSTSVGPIPSTSLGTTTFSTITYTIPYRTSYPAPDSFITVSGQANSNYNGTYQIASIGSSTLITVANNGSLAVGMVVSTISSSAYVPPYCIIQSLIGTTQFTISPAAWLPAGTSISAQASATVSSVTITNGGNGSYTTAPTITFSGGGAITQAQATCAVSNGYIVSVLITSPGYGYTSIPTLTLSQVLGNAILTPVLTSIIQTNATVTTGVNTNTMTLVYPTAPGLSANATATVHSVGSLGSGPTASGTTLTAGTGASGLVVGMIIAGVTPVSGSALTYISAFAGGSGGAGTYTLNQSVTGTPTSATLDLLSVSSITNLTVGASLTFTNTTAYPVFGGVASATTYYVTQIVGTTQIGISLTSGGNNITLTTVGSGQMAFYAPCFTYGTSYVNTATGPTVTTVSSGTYSGTYSVTYTFSSTTAPTTGVYYYVSGNTNPLFNGYAICSGSSTTSITLNYPFNPGTYSNATTTTIYREATTTSATSLGISKPFSTTNASGLRLGYPANEPAQITTKISTCRATGHDFLNIGTGGYTTTNWPTVIYGNPSQAANQSQEILEESVGRCFYVTTDQNGIFRVGRFFSVDQGTGAVTFSASIALSNLTGLGFKRGVVVAEFSTDSAMTNNASDTVPVQSAIRSFIDRRLGLDYGGNPIASTNIIGNGYLSLGGQLAMKASLNMALNTINNLGSPAVNTDAANKLYVDTQITTVNSLYKLKDISNVLGTSLSSGQFLVYDTTTLNNNNTSGGWRNIGIPTGDVNIIFNSVAGTLTTVLQASVVKDSNVSFSAAIQQSKLLLNSASTASTSTSGTQAVIQASLGLSSFNSKVFTTTNGWVDLANSADATTGILYGKIQYVSSGTILGNRTGSSATVREMTPVQVVADGNAISNANFTTTGIMTVATTGNSTFNLVTNIGGGNSYSITPVSIANAASSIVKSDSDKSVDVGSLKILGYTSLTVTNSNTLNLRTPGGIINLALTGASSSNASTTLIGTFDATGGTLKTTTLTTGAPATAGSITGQWSVGASSQIDFTQGTLKSITLTTGADTTVGTIQGYWSLTGSSRLQATYADLAEFYEGDQEYEPGTVLVFGGDREVTSTSTFNDTRLAGVVTTNPAYVMNQDQTGIKVCVALAGRVPVKVVGRVKKGDMLTTSATPGCAVKATNPQVGSIIGKAIQDKDYDSVGIIEVAVGRS